MINFICAVNFADDITPYSTEIAVVEATNKVKQTRSRWQLKHLCIEPTAYMKLI